MARLAEEEGDDHFGENDDDWLVLRDVEESEHYSELEAMETELREIDPEWKQSKDYHHLKETNQLFLQTDLIKCQEIYFQPSIVGVAQSDLI